MIDAILSHIMEMFICPNGKRVTVISGDRLHASRFIRLSADCLSLNPGPFLTNIREWKI